MTDLTDAQGSWRYFSIVVPEAQPQLAITISGGAGDADLYVRRGALPTLEEFNERPYVGGNDEAVAITDPAADTYYVGVFGYESYSGLTLAASYGDGGGGGGIPAELEPNDDPSSANVVEAPADLAGMIASATDIDCFEVSAPEGGELSVHLRMPADRDYDLDIEDASGNVLARSLNDLGLDEDLLVSASGPLYVKVYGFAQAFSETEPYHLTLSW